MGQHNFWPQTLWVSFLGQKPTNFVSFWSQFFPESWPIEKEQTCIGLCMSSIVQDK
jgi:hypothetical protein